MSKLCSTVGLTHHWISPSLSLLICKMGMRAVCTLCDQERDDTLYVMGRAQISREWMLAVLMIVFSVCRWNCTLGQKEVFPESIWCLRNKTGKTQGRTHQSHRQNNREQSPTSHQKTIKAPSKNYTQRETWLYLCSGFWNICCLIETR